MPVHHRARRNGPMAWLTIGLLTLLSACGGRGPTLAEFEDQIWRYKVAQEQYYAWARHYATQAEMDTAFVWRYQPAPGFAIEVLTATTAGHSALVRHSSRPDLVCGVQVGNAPQPIAEATPNRTPCITRQESP